MNSYKFTNFYGSYKWNFKFSKKSWILRLFKIHTVRILSLCSPPLLTLLTGGWCSASEAQWPLWSTDAGNDQAVISFNERLEMRANAQPDGRPVEYRWRPLFNAAVWLTPTSVQCSNAAKTRNPLKFAGVPQTNEMISALVGRSSPCCKDMWRR